MDEVDELLAAVDFDDGYLFAISLFEVRIPIDPDFLEFEAKFGL